MLVSPLAAAAAPASTLPWVIVCGLLFLVLIGLAWRFVLKDEGLQSWSRPAVLGSYLVLLLLSLGLRLCLATAFEGVSTDIACFKAWAIAAAGGGLSRFYTGSMFVDYPPGYIYVLKVVGHARILLGLAPESAGFLLLIKLPAILLDLGAAGLVLWLARARTSLASACTLSLLVAWNPAAIHNSAVYGQVDVFLAVPLVLALVFVYRGALLRASGIYTAAVLIKPQALLLGPLALLALVRRRNAKTAGLALLIVAAMLAVLLSPFSHSLNPAWLVSLYARTMGSYPYATLNAANFHALIGANWAPVGNEMVLMSYGAFSTVCLGAIVLFSAWLYMKGRADSDIFVVALVVVSSVFFLTTRMHERYLYPAILIAAATYVVTKDARFLVLFGGYSLSVFLNQALLHDLVYRTGSFFVASDDLILRLLSLANGGLVAFSVAVAIDICVRHKVKSFAPFSGGGSRTPVPAPAPKFSPPDALAVNGPARLSRVDFLLMSALTLSYAAVAFTNLGSFKAPQTCWRSSSVGETAYLDLGEPRHVGRIVYFMGLGEGAYALDLSVDGQRWNPAGNLEQPSRFEKFEWRVTTPRDPQARFLRVTTEKPGAMLCEISVFGDPKEKPWPLHAAPPPGITNTSGGAALALADEPTTAPYDPSFMSGMYFDEIFFARTAYELVHQIEPTETTHPPLGKAIIAMGVAVFGMTPFGWRFMGTLFGVAMVPLLYLFAHRIFRRTELAFLAAFLFAFDFMHFAQTRIATIDGYAVFFVILMYFFMYEYVTRDFWQARTRDLLLPLLLSGIAFGFGAASKWSVIYGGAGLAVVLFASLLARRREYLKAKKQGSRKVKRTRAERASQVTAVFPRRALVVLGWCIVSFVLVPGLIYLLAYLPFMQLPGPGHALRDVVASQGYMYRYHSEMKQTHPFSSPWWQWPILERPVWYYAGAFGLRDGKVSTIVSLGNPAVWWPGIAAVGAGIWLAIRRREASIAFILVGLFSEFLPWAIAPRKLVFIYHFFPSVPFMVLAIVYGAKVMMDRHPAFRHVVRGYCVVVLGLFVLFYPILSAMPVRRDFVLHWLRWFNSWTFC